MSSKLIASFDLSKLSKNDLNPRRITPEAREALKRNLERHGNVGLLVARKMPDGSHRLVSGHQRLDVMLGNGETKAPVQVVECSDADEQHMLLVLNGHAGTWDNTQLADLLETMEKNGEKIEDIGVSQADMDALLEQVAAGDTGDGGAGDGPGLGTPIIHYDIVFDTEEQQGLWFKYLRFLKESYAVEETIGARLSRHLREQGFVGETANG